MGERLGRYTVLRHLASGGMAEVLLARSGGIEGFERHVVLKRIKRAHADDARFVEMFLDEARLAANLHHQNIVQVHDIGEAEGEYFFAMEYIHGEDLRALLGTMSRVRQHLPLTHLVTIASAVASGLHYAHERRGTDKKPLGIVHRDVSPSNILVGYDGSVKIVDFGIAKAALRNADTRSGALKGKVSYMSPEQCKLQPVDRRSDIYSLGVVLYELATTTRLFKSDSDYLVMDAICTGKVPPPRARRADLPEELAKILVKTLALDPDARFQTADELRVALDQFAANARLPAAGTLGSYLRKMFGEKPEPWLESGITPQIKGEAHAETVPLDARLRPVDSRIKITSGEPVSGDDETHPGVVPQETTTSGGRARSSVRPAAITVGPELPVPSSNPNTSTSIKGQSQRAITSAGESAPARIAVFAIPLVIVAAGAAYYLRGDREAAESGHSAVQPAAAPSAVVSTPAPELPSAGSGAPAAVAPPSSVAALPPPPNEATVARDRPASTSSPTSASTTRPGPRPTERRTTPPTSVRASTTAGTGPAPAGAATNSSGAGGTPGPKGWAAGREHPAAAASSPPSPPSTVASGAGSAAATAAGSAVAPPPTPSKPPPVVELEVAQIAPSVVDALASRNRRALLACENGETLSGDVTVRFEVDGDGKVTRSQLSSSLGKPKVASCILGVVRSWKFPKPPTGLAKGVYQISYQ